MVKTFKIDNAEIVIREDYISSDSSFGFILKKLPLELVNDSFILSDGRLICNGYVLNIQTLDWIKGKNTLKARTL